MNFVLIWIIQGIICGCLACFIAKEKDYGKFSWFCIGLFFGIFGLIAAAGLPDKDLKDAIKFHFKELEGLTGSKEDKNKKSYLKNWKCPKCGEMNPDNFYSCSKCDYELIKEESKEKTYLKEWKCPWCKKMNSKDTNICIECGYSIK